MRQGIKKRTLSIVFRAPKPKEVNHLRTAPFLDIWAPFYHHGNGDARPRYLKQPPLRLAESDILSNCAYPNILTLLDLVLLWPPISIGTYHINHLYGKVAGYVHPCRILLSATTCMEWSLVASLEHVFDHALSTAVQCGVVHHLPCWRILRKCSFEWQEQSSGIQLCRTCQHFNRLISPLSPLCRG